MKANVVSSFALVLALGLTASVLACPPGVTDLVCSEIPGEVLLTWTNNNDGSYTFIEIVRNDDTLAILPVDSTSYLDTSPVGGVSIYVVFAHDGAAPTGAACVLGADPLVLRSPDLTAATGSVIDIPIIMDCPFESFGFSLGYAHDPDKVTFQQGVAGATVAAMNDGDGAAFFVVQFFAGLETGFFSGCVYSLLGVSQLLAGTDYELIVATYSVDADGPDSTELEFTNNLGDPPASLIVVVLPQNIFLVPETDGTTLTIGSGNFVRGDTNDDGVVGLPDVLITLNAMFLGGELLCAAAADADADMQLLIIDPILCLNYLYQAGPPPAPPFPGCGADPMNMGCDQYTSCP